ncbi:hypothetical protein DXG01_000414 [Tephrocybe rancida]|nr:hypothetical protein DXG01_000414 [Tephrocybe rancida]
MFTNLEVQYGLDINNTQHIWLLHFLFLDTINRQLEFFAQSWNQHRIQISGGSNRSPADMFGFDMLVHGVRGSHLPVEEELSIEEQEVYGTDWAELRDKTVLRSRQANNPTDEGLTSWLGHTGPPERLNEVRVHEPEGIFTPGDIEYLNASVGHLAGTAEPANVVQLWTQAFAIARQRYPNHF